MSSQAQLPVERLHKWKVAKYYGITVRTLMRDLQGLIPDLEALGYRTTSQMFTPAMIKKIGEFLGPLPEKQPGK